MNEPSQGQRTYVIVAIIVVVGVLLSLCAGALAGGAVALAVLRSRAQPAAVPIPGPEEQAPTLPFRMPFSPQGQALGAALIQEVQPDTPADEAGLRAGDLIIAVDGQPLDQAHPLDELIGAHKPGDRVEITIVRGNRKMTIGLTLSEHPDDPNRAFLGVRFVPIFVMPPREQGR